MWPLTPVDDEHAAGLQTGTRKAEKWICSRPWEDDDIDRQEGELRLASVRLSLLFVLLLWMPSFGALRFRSANKLLALELQTLGRPGFHYNMVYLRFDT